MPDTLTYIKKKKIQVNFVCLSRPEYKDSRRGRFYYCAFETFLRQVLHQRNISDLFVACLRNLPGEQQALLYIQREQKSWWSCLFTQHNANLMSSSGHITCRPCNPLATLCTETDHPYVYPLKNYGHPMATSCPLQISWMTAPTFQQKNNSIDALFS